MPFTVAPNPNGTTRSGSITVGGDTSQTVAVSQAAAPCVYSLTPSSASAPSTGGSVSVSVGAPGGCAWTAASNASWIAVASGQSGNGNGTVNLSVAADTSTDRSGQVTIAGQRYTITQSGSEAPGTPPGCSYALSRTSDTIDASGGSASITVSTSMDCTWAAVSNAPWIAVASGKSGTGSGTVTLTFAANSGAQRTGTVTIAGQTYTATENAPPGPTCTYSLSRTADSFPSNGGTTTVSVTTAGGCAWAATANVLWITVSAGAAGAGNGTVGLSIAANTGPQRSGTVTIAGQTYTATESAATVTFTGTVSGLTGSCPSITFSAAGRTINANSDTTFKGGKCTNVRNGLSVTVTGDETGTSSLTASTIQLNN